MYAFFCVFVPCNTEVVYNSTHLFPPFYTSFPAKENSPEIALFSSFDTVGRNEGPDTAGFFGCFLLGFRRGGGFFASSSQKARSYKI